MPTPSLDTVIRQLAKQQHRSLMAAAKGHREHYLALAAKAKDAAGKARFKAMAKHAMDEGTAAANRLRMSADNAADSYARAMRRLADEAASEEAKAKAVKAKPAKKAAVKKKSRA